MSRLKFLIFVWLVLGLVALSWGIDQSWAQQAPKKDVPAAQAPTLEQAQQEAAAVRAAQGLHRNITQGQREAVAARAAAARDAAEKAKGDAK
jgi:hypothetical protein